MKILISTRSASGVHSSKLESFAQGIAVCGDAVVPDTDNPQHCDLAVIYGSGTMCQQLFKQLLNNLLFGFNCSNSFTHILIYSKILRCVRYRCLENSR